MKLINIGDAATAKKKFGLEEEMAFVKLPAPGSFYLSHKVNTLSSIL